MSDIPASSSHATKAMEAASDISPEEVNKLVAVWKRLYELGQEPTWRRIEDITKIPLKEIWQHD